jgi:hypothetical protein
MLFACLPSTEHCLLPAKREESAAQSNEEDSQLAASVSAFESELLQLQQQVKIMSLTFILQCTA